MTERINGQGPRPADLHGARRADAAKPRAAAAGSASAAGSSDRVELTPSAQLLKRLEQALLSQPVVSAERVQAVKDKLAAGTYEVDTQKVADQMLRLDRELLA